MDGPATCVYCSRPIDRTKTFWIFERWEGGGCVARGAVDHSGCLHATGGLQAARGPDSTPQLRGVLPPVEDRVIEEAIEHPPR
jgi:hypothetical protein